MTPLQTLIEIATLIGLVLAGYAFIEKKINTVVKIMKTEFESELKKIKEQIDETKKESEEIKHNYISRFDRVEKRFDDANEKMSEIQESISDTKDGLRQTISETREQMIKGFGDIKEFILNKT